MANIIGTSFGETLEGTSGTDTINGNGGNDLLVGFAGTDWLYGGAGNDLLYSHARLIGPDEVATPTFLTKEPGDTFADVDRLFGGANSDRLFAGYGDHVDGGEGKDYLYINFLGATAGVTADFRLMAGGSITIGGGVISGIEHVEYVIGSAFDDFIAVDQASVSEEFVTDGGDGNDHLIAVLSEGSFGQFFGGAGNDILDGRGGVNADYFGGDGDDTIYTSAGNSFADGGAGNDSIYASRNTRGGTGNDVIVLSSLIDTTPADRVAYGDEGNDTISVDPLSPVFAGAGFRLVGNAGADVLTGGAGNDFLQSGGTSDLSNEDIELDVDRLSAGAGDDVVNIGFGDFADGGDGVDRLILSLRASPVGVSLDLGSLLGSNPATISGATIVNFESINKVIGTAFDDTFVLPIIGKFNFLETGAGNDVIIGATQLVYAATSDGDIDAGDGDDRFEVRGTTSVFDGGTGIDTIDFSVFNQAVDVNLTEPQAAPILGPNGMRILRTENVLGSIFDDKLSGDVLANTLVGNAGNDSIYGESGDDKLEGGTGNDLLQGDAGADTARYAGNRADFTIIQLSATQF